MGAELFGAVGTVFETASAMVQLAAAEKNIKAQSNELMRQDEEQVKLFEARMQSRVAKFKQETGRIAVAGASGGVTGASLETIKGNAENRLRVTQKFDVEALDAERSANLAARVQLQKNLKAMRIQTGLNVAASAFGAGTQIGQAAAAGSAQASADEASRNARTSQLSATTSSDIATFNEAERNSSELGQFLDNTNIESPLAERTTSA
jgi:hypothetical protein